MSMLLCLIDRDGGPIPDDVAHTFDRRRPTRTCVTPAIWHRHGSFAALVGSDTVGLDPVVASASGWYGVGMVRLFHSAAAAVPLSQTQRAQSDLATVLTQLAEFGPSAIRRVSGVFVFVAWHPERREIIAARDTFGTWRLYLAQRNELLAFSTRASILADDSPYDQEFIAEYLVNGDCPDGRSAFSGVQAIQTAEILQATPPRCQRRRYWPILTDSAGHSSVMHDSIATVERFRSLLFQAVSRSIDNRADVWSELSGGMDSSSIVAAANALASRRSIASALAGVATYLPPAGVGGDEHFAAIAARASGVKQRVVTGWWSWQEEDGDPAMFDQPGGDQRYVQIRKVTRLVREMGGRVILSGLGADIYLRPHFAAAADHLAAGNLRHATRLLLTWAVATRTSFWRLAYEHGIYPNLPRTLRQSFPRSAWKIPEWVSPSFVHAFNLRERTPAVRLYSGAWGNKVRTSVVARLLSEESSMARDMIGEVNLEWRYPYLSRELVDFALTLPTEWQFGNGLSKRILREAMHGLLPDPVRLRAGKGGLHVAHRIALRREQDRLRRLFERSVLGQIGWIMPNKLLDAISRHLVHKHAPVPLMLHHAISLELWLQKRHSNTN